MARTTIDTAVAQIGNRFDLILIASRRVRELRSGSEPLAPTKSNAVETALTEIENGKIGREYLKKTDPAEPPKRRRR